MEEEYGSFSDSMRNVKHRNDRAEFYGLLSDIDKLPADDSVPSGSTAYCVDTGDVYIYLKSTRKWYPQ